MGAVIEAFRQVTLRLWPRPVVDASSSSFIIQEAGDSQESSGGRPTGLVLDTDGTLVQQPHQSNQKSQAQPQQGPGAATGESQDLYEEAVIHGMSLSPNGFCVILKGLVCERLAHLIHLTLLYHPSSPDPYRSQVYARLGDPLRSHVRRLRQRGDHQFTLLNHFLTNQLIVITTHTHHTTHHISYNHTPHTHHTYP